MIQVLLRACLAAAMFTMTAPAFAILPQQGMWSIGSEANGKPGRGIQIDQQGGQFLILTYIGYRADGSATFMQASGKIENGKNFTADLTEYRNGRALGGAAREGEVAYTAGKVTIQFQSPTSGTIKLPGEPAQSFSRYQYENHLARLNHRFTAYFASPLGVGRTPASITITADGNKFEMREAYGYESDAPVCTYVGNLSPAGDAFSSRGTVQCTNPGPGTIKADSYRINELRVDTHGTLSGRIFTWTEDQLLPGATLPGGIRYLGGECVTNIPWFGSPARCYPQELGVTGEDQRE